MRMDYCIDHLTDSQAQMHSFWDLIRVEIDSIKADHTAFKTQDLPLARIKKIMKLDDDIKCMMISAEAPILFAKAAELFIRELTLRAWIHTERNRRRTLQRNDIAMAVSDGDTDQFDFLIDIVPREEARGHRRPSQTTSTPTVNNSISNNNSNNVSNVKLENSLVSGNYITNTNGTHTITLDQQSSNQIVLSGLTNDTTDTISQSQTLTSATSTVLSVASGISCQTIPPNQITALQFATLPTSITGDMTTTSDNNSSSTTTEGTSTTAASAAAAVQYVLQLPVGTGGNAAAQPFQIQVFPQHFQTSSTDAISSNNQANTLLTDANGNTIPVVQVVSQPGATGLALPILQDSNGNRTRILHLQMPESSTSVSGC